MCVAHEHGGDKSGIRKTRKLADASYVIQLTAFEKCCNITKVVVGKVKYILCTCIFAYECKKCILLVSVGKRKARS